FTILDFINPILSFSGSFRDFLAPFTFFELVKQADKLRQMVGYIEDIVLSENENFNDIEKLKTINEYVVIIQTNFETNSAFSQLVENIQSNINDFISSLLGALELIPKLIIKNDSVPTIEKTSLDIPKLYVEKLLVAELSTNMKKYIKQESKPTVL